VPPYVEQAYHMFYLLMPSLETRARLIEYLKARSILAVFHYVPLHLSEMGMRFGGRPGECPITESVSDRLVRLPFYNDLQPDQQAEVIEAICSFRC
jgi:dTDP-4-amino-4,6-dideoxygalactose transaminase